MHQQFERLIGKGFLQQRRHRLIGLTRMDHQRQAGALGRLDMSLEDGDLNIAGAEIVVEVQPSLSDPHHLRTFGHLA